MFMEPQESAEVVVQGSGARGGSVREVGSLQGVTLHAENCRVAGADPPVCDDRLAGASAAGCGQPQAVTAGWLFHQIEVLHCRAPPVGPTHIPVSLQWSCIREPT